MKKIMILFLLISVSDLFAKPNLQGKVADKTTAAKAEGVEKKEELQATLTTKVDDIKTDHQETQKIKKEDKITKLTAEEQAKADARSNARKTTVTEGMDLSGKDLSRYIFAGPSLQKIVMDSTTKNSTGIDFTGCNLTGASLIGTDLSNCNFTNANLSGVDFTGAILTGVIFTGAGYNDNTKLSVDQKKGMKIAATSGMNLSGKDLSQYYFKYQVINGIIIDDTSTGTQGVDFTGADATEANLCGATLAGAVFKGAILSNADLSWGSFSDKNSPSDFTDANLQGANLTASEFINANFTGAQLQNTQLLTSFWDVYTYPADFTNANFAGADLTGALCDVNTNFKDAQYDDSTKLPATLTPDQKKIMIKK